METPRLHPPSASPDEALQRLVQRLGPSDGQRVERIGPAPCSRACPAGINVKRYVGLVAEGRYEEALQVVREDNPLAAVCGYLCHRPCEAECALGRQGRPLSVRALKRLAARVVDETGRAPEVPPLPSSLGRVAVLGGGPAGLTAARDLRRLGYGVTLFEASDRLGGLLASAVPAHRLPTWALAADLAYVRAHDIDVRTGARLGANPLERLEAEGYAAVIIATGAGVPLMKLPGAEQAKSGYTHALSVLRELTAGRPAPDAKRAVVLGAGPVGVDAATALARAGIPRVELVHHRGPGTLPVDPEALHEANRAGVVLRCWLRAERLETVDGDVRGVRLRARIEAGQARAGRTPLTDGPPHDLAADLVVDAQDRLADVEAFQPALETTALGGIRVDPTTLRASRPGVWVAGEAAAGPRSVIEAVAMGRRAAAQVHAALAGVDAATPGWRSRGGWRLSTSAPDQVSAWRHVPADDRGAGQTAFGAYDEVADPRAGHLEPAGQAEARRCLRCGPCTDCAVCSPYCGEEHAVDRTGVWVRLPCDLPDRERVGAEITVARVDEKRCRGCGLCEEHCPYSAPRVTAQRSSVRNTSFVARVDADACRGCGVCVSRCPTGAMGQGGFTNQRLAAAIDGACQPSRGGA